MGKGLERRAGQGVGPYALPALPLPVVEKGAELCAAELGRGVGDGLQQGLEVERGSERLAGAVQHLEDARFVAQGFLDPRAAHRFARMARHVLGQRHFARGPVARLRFVQVEDRGQPPAFDDRHHDHGARTDAGVAVRIGRGQRIGGDVVEAQHQAGAQALDQRRAEGVQLPRLAGQAGDRAVGPVAFDGDALARGVDLAVADAAHCQVLAQQGAGRLHDPERIEQFAQGRGQLQVEAVLLFGQHARGGVGQDAAGGDDGAAFVHRRGRQGQVTPGFVPVLLDVEAQVLEQRRLPFQGCGDEGRQFGPGGDTDLRQRLSERGRMAVAEQGGAGVVVDDAQFASPGHEHRQARAEDRVDDDAQPVGHALRQDDSGARGRTPAFAAVGRGRGAHRFSHAEYITGVRGISGRL